MPAQPPATNASTSSPHSRNPSRRMNPEAHFSPRQPKGPSVDRGRTDRSASSTVSQGTGPARPARITNRFRYRSESRRPREHAAVEHFRYFVPVQRPDELEHPRNRAAASHRTRRRDSVHVAESPDIAASRQEGLGIELPRHLRQPLASVVGDIHLDDVFRRSELRSPLLRRTPPIARRDAGPTSARLSVASNPPQRPIDAIVPETINHQTHLEIEFVARHDPQPFVSRSAILFRNSCAKSSWCTAFPGAE